MYFTLFAAFFAIFTQSGMVLAQSICPEPYVSKNFKALPAFAGWPAFVAQHKSKLNLSLSGDQGRYMSFERILYLTKNRKYVCLGIL